jgi:hypothetical protein
VASGALYFLILLTLYLLLYLALRRLDRRWGLIGAALAFVLSVAVEWFRPEAREWKCCIWLGGTLCSSGLG